jgi:hypothetical protein
MLITKIDEFKRSFPTMLSFELSDLHSDLVAVENDWMRDELLGNDTYYYLHTAYIDAIKKPNPTTLGVKEKELLRKCQDVIAPMAFANYLPFAQGKAGQSGIMIVENEEMRPAPKWMVEQQLESAIEKSYKAMERLLRYLESESAYFVDWTISPQATLYKKGFIWDAAEFDKFVKINKSRRLFSKIQSSMDWIEETKIKPLLGDVLFNNIISELRSNSISQHNEALLPFIKRAVACLSFNIAAHSLRIITSENGFLLYESLQSNEARFKKSAPIADLTPMLRNIELMGSEALKSLSDYLYANSANYPDFVASSAYKPNNEQVYKPDQNLNVGGFI